MPKVIHLAIPGGFIPMGLIRKPYSLSFIK